MTYKILLPNQIEEWRETLKKFSRVDVCQLPEYNIAYQRRIRNSQACMWCYKDSFCYPFLLTPVQVRDKNNNVHQTEYYDISSIYGYSGPLCSDKAILEDAWSAFDDWSKEQKVIAEFTRYSLFAKTNENAHPETEILDNRPSAVTYLDGDLLQSLGKKTRNMIRKAEKSGLIAEELDPKAYMDSFRALYDETMERNKATDFFAYDDVYYDTLLSIPGEELRLFGAFDQGKMVAAAISLSHGDGALYHLGASLREYSNLGAGNLALYSMSAALQEGGVKFITVGGGRTTVSDDPLFRFKKSNASHVETFQIGKRIVNQKGYKEVVDLWESLYKKPIETSNLIFYR